MRSNHWWLAGCGLLALSLAYFAASAPVSARATMPHGGGGTALILFDGPIYAGHNNGFAEGPVGTLATVELRFMNQPPANWTLGVGVDLWLYRQQNAALGDHTCSGTPGAIHIGAMPALDGTGGATLAFIWPAAASQAAGPDFGACVHQAGAATPYLFSTDLDSFQHFYVLTNAPATLTVAPSVVHRGDTLTVTGHNWGPIFADVAGSAIQVAIGRCNAGLSLGGTTVTSLSGGSFSVSFTIPAAAPFIPDAQACASSDYQHIDSLTGSSQTPPTFTIAAMTPPTATPVPATATPAATATPIRTATPVPTPGHSGGGGPCSGGMVVLLSAFMSIIFISRRKKAVLLRARDTR